MAEQRIANKRLDQDGGAFIDRRLAFNKNNLQILDNGWNNYVLTVDEFGITSLTEVTAGSSSFAVSSSYADTASYSFFAVTASFAQNFNPAATASYALQALSASFATSASRAVSASVADSASRAISSSYALSSSVAVSSSYALSASYVLQAVSASFATSASTAVSASYALSASFALTASFVISSSYALSASFASTASYVLNAVSASFVTSASYALSASFATSASRAVTASYAINAQNVAVSTANDNVNYSILLAVPNHDEFERVWADNTNASYNPSTGTLTVVQLVETSARRFKENIEPLKGSLEGVQQLQGVSFNRIGDPDKKLGFIAEDVAEVYPELVEYTQDGEVQGLAYQRMVAVLVEAVKELSDKVQTQEIFIKDLESRIKNLETK